MTKAAAGSRKLALGLVPPAFKVAVAGALAAGARKYGPYDWRARGGVASSYAHAMERHLALWQAGEDLDPETGLHHLAHVAATCAVALDAADCGSLADDRERSPWTRAALDAAAVP